MAYINEGGLNEKEFQQFQEICNLHLGERLDRMQEHYDAHVSINDRDSNEQKLTLRLYTKRFNTIVSTSHEERIIPAMKEVCDKALESVTEESAKQYRKHRN